MNGAASGGGEGGTAAPPSLEPVPLVALIILDGWGSAPPGPGNAVSQADTPVYDRLWARYPHTTIKCSGTAVGLPDGQMGNSEVGHLTIGSGRILRQSLQRLNNDVESGALLENKVLKDAFERARERGGNVHLLGLVSYGGVHSHIDHLRALLELAKRQGMFERTYVDAFTDGRDVSPNAAVEDLAELPSDRIASVMGRYYAMDRDKRWDRIEIALDALIEGKGKQASSPVVAVQESYDEGVSDEFIKPIVVTGRPRIDKADVLIFFNFRPDRARQLSSKLLELGYDLTTMTSYDDDLDCPVAYGDENVTETMAELLSENGLKQLHIAETEKYAHVTYFFNGGREEEFPGETRILVPSPREVPSYDKKPEMSAPEVAKRFCAAIETGEYAFAVVNFANADMVGHTGSIPATIKALETVDRCLDEVVSSVQAQGGVCLITADHGNAEKMLADDGVSPFTAHTSSDVPLILTKEGAKLRSGGELSDLIPTAIALLSLRKPLVMTGVSLIS
ncbi:MAG: 2,3-bisphosphoglycerate-independent phosphoglycerate mutase [Gaiellaceae bacterium]|jgi:2,3-bisphosphoglycerate-independent phosphoglycerate mutase